MPFDYKKVLVVGATSGIGKAFAERFVANGSKVIVSGRRTERLEEFVKEHGADKASAVTFDVSMLDQIPDFVTKVTEANPDLDFVFLNAGTQVPFDFSNPGSVDIHAFSNEVTTNYTSLVVLTHAFLPFLLKQSHQTALAYTTSCLALIPMFRAPGYSATKAATHSFLLSLRSQLQDTKVKIVEIFPPAVQTELHDYMGLSGRDVGMPLNKFIDSAYKQLEEGSEEVIIKDQVPQFENTLDVMRKGFEIMTSHMRGTNLAQRAK